MARSSIRAGFARTFPLAGMLALFAALAAGPATAATASTLPADTAAAKRAVANAGALEPEKLLEAIVRVNTVAVPDARSSATLGSAREGSGVIIGDGGLILTIGYLIIEADEVKVTDSRGRTLPARVVGYDHATGLGLLRSIVPLEIAPLPLGESGRIAVEDPVMILNHHGADDVTLTRVVSKRPFTASWEYQLEYAVFTSPPTLEWSGAALIGRDGRLLGIGSLFVREAAGEDGVRPGNMFVPIDALKPILSDLTQSGRRAGPARPWLGMSTDEVQGRLQVSRVSPGGPADEAGVHAGDIVLAVGASAVRSQADFYKYVWSRGAAGTDIPIKLLQGVDVNELRVHSIDRTEYFRPRTTY